MWTVLRGQGMVSLLLSPEVRIPGFSVGLGDAWQEIVVEEQWAEGWVRDRNLDTGRKPTFV